ncbi:uncharacterized protein LOC123194586 isoform X2 [Mangifera indica]|uniref:uncharacterized protein LOC123194586 isoform X2 n=1 Tax=Mangifera indica TaxID=29780 RepID=UPI001CFA29C8|nr:uncharacterized protein LOC123194586 isoform X2 [Mangifera indica]XP_044463800.1 uncharacterized protein LOC123194586 isoform X2 [Mangifera indica]XP_044463801.1 uncharacterized protein LOC123194586 isoform X2 [Mangifera indica]
MDPRHSTHIKHKRWAGFIWTAMEKMAPEPKRRKIRQPPSRRPVSSPTAEKSRDATSVSHFTAATAQTSEINVRIQQAKNFSVAQAQQEETEPSKERQVAIKGGPFCQLAQPPSA